MHRKLSCLFQFSCSSNSSILVVVQGAVALSAEVEDRTVPGAIRGAGVLVAAIQVEDEVDGGLLLDVVVGEEAIVLQTGRTSPRGGGDWLLQAAEDQSLMVRGDPLLVPDLELDILDSVRRLHLEGVHNADEGLDEDLHPGAEADWKSASCQFHGFVLIKYEDL